MLCAISVWQPIASIVTRHPLMCRSSSRRGMALISFDFSSVLTCPKTRRLCVAHALTMWTNTLPAASRNERRSVLPSMATTSPPVICATAFTQSRNAFESAFGSSAASTRPMVSCDGIPLGRSRKDSSQARLALAHSSTATNDSAPQTIAHSVTSRMLDSGCNQGATATARFADRGPERSTVELVAQLRDPCIERLEREEGLVAQARQDPALRDEHARLDLGLVARVR